MSELFYIKDTLENRISYFLLLLFVVFLPFDRFYSEWIFIAFCIHTLIHTRKWDFINLLKPRVLILQSVFILAVLSSTWSSFKPEAIQECLKLLSILLFPLMLCLTHLRIGKYKGRLLTGFSYSCVVVVVYLNTDALRIINFYHYPLKSLFSSSFLNQNFSNPIDLHPTYLGMYLLLSIVYLITELRSHTSVKQKPLVILCILVLALGILQASSKSVIISFIIIISLLFPFYIVTQTRRIWLIVLASISICVLGFLIIKNDDFRERLFTEFKEDLSIQQLVKTSNEPRIIRWSGAVELIRKAPIIGYGMGAEKPILSKMYYQKKLYNSFLNDLDAHNQYLSFLLTAGITGLVVYFFTLCWGFRQAHLKKDFIFMSFLIIITIVGISENILMVNKGIFFYIFFFSLFSLPERFIYPSTPPFRDRQPPGIN